jgi:DnaJ-class molecular chaperone
MKLYRCACQRFFTPCEECQSREPTTCPACNGRGEIEDSGDPSTGYGPVNVECRKCEGRGTL